MTKKKTTKAGAPQKYGEPTVLVPGDRVPKSKVKTFKAYKKSKLSKWIVSK